MSSPRSVPPASAREVIWKTMTEKAWAKWVQSTADEFGWEHYHPWLSVHSPRGWPDEALCRPPRLILAELKSMTGKVSPAQEHWGQLLEACPGVEYHLWRPCDEDDVIRTLAWDGRAVHL